MAITPERLAEIKADLEETLGPLNPQLKPKVVTKNAEEVRDADVHVSRADKNAKKGVDEVVQVRRADWVMVDMAAYEAQQKWKAEERQRRMYGPNYVADREARKKLDPDRLGLYGPVDWDND
jgi:hypothetical protein